MYALGGRRLNRKRNANIPPTHRCCNACYHGCDADLIDHTQAIPAPDTCPDCGTAFTGTGTTRDRIVEDIDLVRPTVITRYVIERRWCPQCRRYHEDAVTQALPRHRLGLHVLLFVVYQKVALGLSYSKIQHELRTYFGLTISVGELPGIVAEIA